MKKNIISACGYSFLALVCPPTRSSQEKIPRIGFLDNSTCFRYRGLFGGVSTSCASLDGLRERISPSSTDFRAKE